MIEHPVHLSKISPPTTTVKASGSAGNGPSTQLDSKEPDGTLVYVFGAKANMENQGNRGIPSATSAIRRQSTVSANPKKDSRRQRKTAKEQIRDQRERIRASIQDRRIMGADGGFADDPSETNCIQMGCDDGPQNSDARTQVPTAEDRAIEKSQEGTDQRAFQSRTNEGHAGDSCMSLSVQEVAQRPILCAFPTISARIVREHSGSTSPPS